MRYLISGAVASLALAGCSSTPSPSAYEDVSMDELVGQWQVESIDQSGIIDRSHITMSFQEDGRVVGSSGCNRYSAMMSEDGEPVAIGKAVSTRMACTPALMKQEQRFLTALQETTALYKLSNTWLVAEDSSGTPRLKMIAMTANHETEVETSKSWRFACGTAGNITIKSMGTDTIELAIADQTHRLPQVVSASGAKYGAGEISFWQKGHEALFESAGRTFECQQL